MGLIRAWDKGRGAGRDRVTGRREREVGRKEGRVKASKRVAPADSPFTAFGARSACRTGMRARATLLPAGGSSSNGPDLDDHVTQWLFRLVQADPASAEAPAAARGCASEATPLLRESGLWTRSPLCAASAVGRSRRCVEGEAGRRPPASPTNSSCHNPSLRKLRYDSLFS